MSNCEKFYLENMSLYSGDRWGNAFKVPIWLCVV